MSARLFRSIASDDWIERLQSDTDGSVHTEWLLLESTQIRDEDMLDQTPCIFDDSRLRVWAAFDGRRAAEDTQQFRRWHPKLAWLTTLSDISSTYDQANHALAHAITHQTLEGVLQFFESPPKYIVPAWQIYASTKIVMGNPAAADDSPVAVATLLSMIYERSRTDDILDHEDSDSERQAKLINSMIMKDKALKILHRYTFEDGTEGVGITMSHLPISKLFPRSVFHLVHKDYNDLVETKELCKSWPKEVRVAYKSLEALGETPWESAAMAWAQHSTTTSDMVVVQLPPLENDLAHTL